MSTREVAEELFISVKTVEAHREHIKQKLGLVEQRRTAPVRDRAQPRSKGLGPARPRPE